MARKFENSQLIRSALRFVLLTMVFAVPLYSQSNPAAPEGTNPQASTSTGEPNQDPAVGPKAELPPSAKPEEMRQAQIDADTKKLYQLSAELRAEVAKTYKESLSLTVLKKAQEIEKLAKSLKAEMNQQAAAAKHPAQ